MESCRSIHLVEQSSFERVAFEAGHNEDIDSFKILFILGYLRKANRIIPM